jgi:hypothetical protein
MVVIGKAELVLRILWFPLDQGLAGCDGPLGVPIATKKKTMIFVATDVH